MVKIETQLAVFLDNRPGMLARATQALAKTAINIRALSILDTVDHAIVRMVVDKPAEAQKSLADLKVMIQCREVIFMEIPNEVGALALIAEKLASAGINLEYAYSTTTSAKNASIVLRTNDLEAALSVLS